MDGAQACALGNMRRAHLANMHRRVEADSQAACSKIASIQVCSKICICCPDRLNFQQGVQAVCSQARRNERKTVARQRWKTQLQLVQQVVKSCDPTCIPHSPMIGMCKPQVDSPP